MAVLTTRRAVVLGVVVAAPFAVAYTWLVPDPANFEAAGAALRRPLDLTATGPARMAELVRFATLAANSHNTQAWHFSGDDAQITLMPDPTRETPAVDPDRHHTFVSLGAAAETLVIAATAYGLTASPVFDAANDNLTITLTPSATASPLLAAVTLRQSNRSIYDGTALTDADQAALTQTVAGTDVALHLITDAPTKSALRDLVIAGNTAQMADPAFVAELRHWLRFSETAALASGDGLFAGCSGNPSMPQWLGDTIFPLVFRTATETAKYATQIDSSAALALLVSATDTAASWVETGRALARLTLQATALGLAHAHANQAVEVPAQRSALAALIGITTGRPSILLRLGRAAPMPYALRRPVADVTL